ncbi:alpha/beta hydrolase [Streptomyces sp. NPDC093252]|uniref:alpha/beta fold hydrolase n=1 Tax=Streptomyces sp. NPDC093252 TaxID=3154980 RepID=UPI003416952E
MPAAPVPATPVPAPASTLTHRLLPTPAGRTHLVEQGDGPLVLLVHGFPEGWYSWRHQLPALAGAGYRAAALDVRGYGRSSRPADPGAYRMLDLVADAVAVVEGLGERSAVIVGHDWGANIAATAALLHPDVFHAVALLSVPYSPPGGPRPSEIFAAMGGAGEGREGESQESREGREGEGREGREGESREGREGEGREGREGEGREEFYVSYFQTPGRAEREIEPDVRGWLAGFYAALSAGTMPGPQAPSPYFVTPGGTLRDRFPAPGVRPAWLGDAELDAFAAEFERTGLTGALNRYRNMDRDWADLAPYAGAPITRPSLFLGGALDASLTWLAPAIEAYPHTLPALAGSHILDGAGHFVQQERPDEVNRLLVSWLTGLGH